MIKFFQKTRRELIDKSNLKSYLIYAVGEILLVMIGILLALQVNTWNENRKIKRSESEAIKNLINEFERNHKDLIRVYNVKKASEKGMRKYLQTLNNDSLSVSYKTSFDRPDVGGYTWNPTNPILNSLLTTGKLDNLGNDSLKLKLASWNDAVEDYLEQQSIYNQIDIPNLFEYEKGKVPLSVMHGNYTLESTTEKYISNIDIPKAREKVINELAYHNQLASCINRMYIQVMSAQEIVQISNHIQEILKTEAN
ncbi:DUF6090 family protein [Ancylomarina sp. YFZ004]